MLVWPQTNLYFDFSKWLQPKQKFIKFKASLKKTILYSTKSTTLNKKIHKKREGQTNVYCRDTNCVCSITHSIQTEFYIFLFLVFLGFFFTHINYHAKLRHLYTICVQHKRITNIRFIGKKRENYNNK